MLKEEGSQPWATFPKTLHCPAQDSGGHGVQDAAAASLGLHRLAWSSTNSGPWSEADLGWSPAHTTSKPPEGQKAHFPYLPASARR